MIFLGLFFVHSGCAYRIHAHQDNETDPEAKWGMGNIESLLPTRTRRTYARHEFKLGIFAISNSSENGSAATVVALIFFKCFICLGISMF